MPALSLLETLRTASLPVHFEEAHLRMLAAASERLTVAAGEVIFRQGDPSDAVCIVLDDASSNTFSYLCVDLIQPPLNA